MKTPISSILVLCCAGILAGAPAFAQPKITSFSPLSGPLGTKVVVKGTTLSSPTAAAIDGTAATFTGNSATQVTVTVPATASGPVSVTTAGGTATSATSFTITPGVTLTPTSGHPSVEVTVTGAGFGPYTAVDIYFDTTDVALAIANGLGVVSMSLQVPTSSQPGTHWVSLVERVNGEGAQETFSVNTNWLMQGYGPTLAGFNPFENTLTTGNVAELTEAWRVDNSPYVNQSPFIEVAGNVFVGDVHGGIHAYSSAGKLLWSAAESGADFEYKTPASNGGLVFFGAGTSVFAFKPTCRADGGVCKPAWVATIAAGVGSGLTLYKGLLYAPGNDGQIYPLTPATGAVGTPFYAATNANGGITTPVSFLTDGSYFYGVGSNLQYVFEGDSGYIPQGGLVSPIALSAGRAFYTTTDGNLNAFDNGAVWATALPGTAGCNSAPVVANNTVYAGACDSISAVAPNDGTLRWSVSVPAPVQGLAVADGVLYACVNSFAGTGGIFAYDALDGSLLWTGGLCGTEAVVANGYVFSVYGFLSAYSLPQLSTATAAGRARPEISTLKPDDNLPARRTPD